MVSQSIIDETLREDERMRRWGFWLAERLPQVTVGSGLTKHKRPPLPEEVPPRCSRVRRALEEYWQAIWPTDPDGERYQLNAAITWARSNTGPNSQAPQHIHWYAQSILHQARFLSPEVDRTIDGHAEHVMQSAVESAYKIGVLFREATWKLEHETAAISAYRLDRKRRIGSVLGGVATKRWAEKRKDILADLALKSIASWVSLSNRQQIRSLKRLAQDYDQDADPKIFHRANGDLLSHRWFSDFLSGLRSSGAIARAVKKP